LLGVDAQHKKTQNAIRNAGDKLAAAAETLNDLMGRDIHTRFRVSDISQVHGELDAPATFEARALEHRPELKKAELQVQQADYDARAKKAEYIPDVSAAVTYFTTANFGNALPSNIATARLQLTWEPWDWGRKRQEYAAKRVKEEQAKVAATATERSVLLEVRNAWRQLEAAQRELELSDAMERTARQKLKEVQEQVKREAVLNKDLFQAQSELASADSGQLHALTAYWDASADLKKAIGEQ
jgi:outer membrane protein